MNKQQIKEAILGKDNCPKEETPLTQFATFHPDMEMVELLLKGADINKSFNNQPLSWILQFCEPNLDTMVQLLFKYKYYSLHLNEMKEFKSLLIILSMVKTKTMMEILKIMKCHRFKLTEAHKIEIHKEEFPKILPYFKAYFNLP